MSLVLRCRVRKRLQVETARLQEEIRVRDKRVQELRCL